MDLTNLRDSLDSSSRERHGLAASTKQNEVRLTRDFKQAAMQLTTLYRTSLSSSKRSYASGYAQSLNDILDVVLLRLQQSPASAPGYRTTAPLAEGHEGALSENREELKWLVRYMRARIEAIKAEREDEEREESEEEEVVEDVECGPSTESNPVRSSHQKATTPSSSMPEERREELANSGARASEREIEMASDVQKEQRSLDEAPTSSFTFTANKSRRALRNANSSTTPHHHRLVSTVPPVRARSPARQLASSSITEGVVPIRVASSDEEEEAARGPSPIRPVTPSRRSQARLGKRHSGREKLSGLELFARGQNAKRRRGAGDRRDEDHHGSMF